MPSMSTASSRIARRISRRSRLPRFLEFRASLPKTPSEKVAKHVIVAEREDLRAGAYDRLSRGWLAG
jgi:acyl-coenzyme A synthetase/AMP-(fatty) acid ligase